MKTAFITEVQNIDKKHNASETYVQVTDQDQKSYLFTEAEVKKALKRASKNQEDIIYREYDIYLKRFV